MLVYYANCPLTSIEGQADRRGGHLCDVLVLAMYCGKMHMLPSFYACQLFLFSALKFNVNY